MDMKILNCIQYFTYYQNVVALNSHFIFHGFCGSGIWSGHDGDSGLSLLNVFWDPAGKTQQREWNYLEVFSFACPTVDVGCCTDPQLAIV